MQRLSPLRFVGINKHDNRTRYYSCSKQRVLHKKSPPCDREQPGRLVLTMPKGEVKMGVVDVKALAEGAGSSRSAKMRELEELLARRDQLEK